MSDDRRGPRPNYYRVKCWATFQGERVEVEVECFDMIDALGFDKSFSLGNLLKYIWRAGRKTLDTREDLSKARVYLDREIQDREHNTIPLPAKAPDLQLPPKEVTQALLQARSDQITGTRRVKCTSCGGSGEIRDGGAPERPCATCGGTGNMRA